VTYLAMDFGLSIRRACELLELSRTSFGYEAREKEDEEAIRKRLKELAEKRRRFGCRRLHVLLRREGVMINHKRTERIYREERLSLRIRRRKKHASSTRIEIPEPLYQNHIWTMDFMSDWLANGRKLKVFSLVDEYTRKCLLIEADTSINGERVCRALSEVSQAEGLPEMIIIDNGPEFIGSALDKWAYERGVKLCFITPGKPIENAYIESFNGRFRDECLNANWFMSMKDAQRIIEDWRTDYNQERPHSGLDYLTPEEFIEKEREKSQAAIAACSSSNNVENSNYDWHNKRG